MSIPPADPFAPARRINGRFVNASGRGQRGFVHFLRWYFSRTRAPWPQTVANVPADRPVARVSDGIRVTLVGHATVLLQVPGLNILTDPHWSERAGPTSWLGVKRVRPPAISFDDLPKIDIVLVSHSHYDHLDHPTLAALQRRDRPLVLTGLNVGAAIPCQNVVELNWWQSHTAADDVIITYVPAEHASARGPFDRNARLWGGFVILAPAGAIYFAADSGYGAHFAVIRERFGPFALALLPIGAYLPRWFMAPVHMNPDEAVMAAETLAAQVTLPIHYGTFRLADDAYDEPLIALQAALAARRGNNLNFRVAGFGQAVDINP
jgi:L-ascorbate metabolism protein UlaG (beta-lactamase superfamily)